MNLVSTWLVGILVAALGLIGLFLASRALDQGVALFGVLLFLFAVLFEFGLIRRVYDEREKAVAEAALSAGSRAA